MRNWSVNKRDLLRYGAGIAATAPFVRVHEALAAFAPEASTRAARLPRRVLYVNANVAAAGRNSGVGYRRAADGTLTPLPGSPYPTGGQGFFVADAPLGPFDGDGQVIIDRQRGILYASNPGSNSVAAFVIASDGSLTPLPGSPFATVGPAPTSLGLHEDSVVVLNSNFDPGQAAGNVPSVALAAINGQGGGLASLSSTLNRLGTNAGPTQALSTNTGPFTFTCEFGSGTIRSFASVSDGSLNTLVPIDLQVPPQQAGAATVPKPLGLWASPNAPILYVGFATTDQIGVYRWNEAGQLTFVRTAPVTGAAPCWLRTSGSGNRLYVINTGNNSISWLDVTDPEVPVERQNLVVPGLAGRLVQFDVSADGLFLYVIQRAITSAVAAAQGTPLLVFAIDPATGSLSQVGGATVALPVPADTNPQGLVAL